MQRLSTEETIVRLGCGAVVGLSIGVMLVVGTVSDFANVFARMAVVVCDSVALFAALAWRFGDGFFEEIEKWPRWI
jgi:hypothetical protein